MFEVPFQSCRWVSKSNKYRLLFEKWRIMFSVFTVLITDYCHLRLSHLLLIIIFGAYVLCVVNLVLVTNITISYNYFPHSMYRITHHALRPLTLTFTRHSLHPNRDISHIKLQRLSMLSYVVSNLITHWTVSYSRAESIVFNCVHICTVDIVRMRFSSAWYCSQLSFLISLHEISASPLPVSRCRRP